MDNRSTASIDISVHINQTLTTIYPEQLLLSASNSEQSVCVVNQGYGENSSVPYDLVVEDLNLQYIDNIPAYNVYIKDKDSNIQILMLAPGVSIADQSKITINEALKNKCSDMGMRISIESTNASVNQSTNSSIPGLLLFLVSPN